MPQHEEILAEIERVRAQRNQRERDVRERMDDALANAINDGFLDRLTRLPIDVEVPNVSSNLRQLPLKRRLAESPLNEAAQAHVLNAINRPGAKFYLAANRWLQAMDGLDIDPSTSTYLVKGTNLMLVRMFSGSLMFNGELAALPERPRFVTATGMIVYGPNYRCKFCPVDRATGVSRCVSDGGVGSEPKASSSKLQTNVDQYAIVRCKDNQVIQTYGNVDGGYVQALMTLEVHPKIVRQLLTASDVSSYQTPQKQRIELLTDEIRSRINQMVFKQLGSNERIVDLLVSGGEISILGHSRNETVRAFLRTVFPRPGTKRETTDLWDDVPDTYEASGRGNHWGYGETNNSNAWASAIAREVTTRVLTALGRKMYDINWLSREVWDVIDDESITQLDEPLGDLVSRANGNVSNRAKALLLATARVYGFERTGTGAERGWTRKQGDDSVTVYDNGEVAIRNRPICIIFAGGDHGDGVSTSKVGLPYGDEIASRMWALATSMRKTINTINYVEQGILDRLFAKRAITDRNVDQVAEEILKEMGVN